MASFLYIHVPMHRDGPKPTSMWYLLSFTKDCRGINYFKEPMLLDWELPPNPIKGNMVVYISHYIRGEPGNLSLILVPINVSNTHWILCVRTNIFYDYKNTNIIIIHLTDN